MNDLSRHLPKGDQRSVADLADWEVDALWRVAESREGLTTVPGKRCPEGPHWTVAQTVSKMEHIVRRDIEKTDHGAFLPTYARHWKVDGRQHSKEYPLLGGYVLFHTHPDNWAGIPDIHGVYRVLAGPNTLRPDKRIPMRVSDAEMQRLFLGCALNLHTRIDPPRYTKYYRPDRDEKRKNSRKPRASKRARGR